MSVHVPYIITHLLFLIIIIVAVVRVFVVVVFRVRVRVIRVVRYVTVLMWYSRPGDSRLGDRRPRSQLRRPFGPCRSCHSHVCLQVPEHGPVVVDRYVLVLLVNREVTTLHRFHQSADERLLNSLVVGVAVHLRKIRGHDIVYGFTERTYKTVGCICYNVVGKT